ncbi:hypothetical protein [Lonepinella sp. BR2474]|uniref:hypothetical protein n=1 Tax=Lonepinella sp. BR2474 TaxID=3434548 RepID=UPI003F6DC1C2
MFRLIMRYIFPFLLKQISQRVDLPPTVANVINSTLKTNFNQKNNASGFDPANINEKTSRKTLLNLLFNAKSEDEADYLRKILKEQSLKKVKNKYLLYILAAAAVAIYPFFLIGQQDWWKIALIAWGVAYILYQQSRKLAFQSHIGEYCAEVAPISYYKQLSSIYKGSQQGYSS